MSFIGQIPDLIDALMSFVVHLDKNRECTLVLTLILKVLGYYKLLDLKINVGRHTQRDTFNSCFR